MSNNIDIETLKSAPIPGYVHPENMNTSRDCAYKTFTEGKKVKKDKSCYENKSTTSQYATIGSSSNDSEEKCPKCGSEAIYTCPCGHSDKKCKNGHVWYLDREGVTINGNPHAQVD